MKKMNCHLLDLSALLQAIRWGLLTFGFIISPAFLKFLLAPWEHARELTHCREELSVILGSASSSDCLKCHRRLPCATSNAYMSHTHDMIFSIHLFTYLARTGLAWYRDRQPPFDHSCMECPPKHYNYGTQNNFQLCTLNFYLPPIGSNYIS